MKTHRNRTGETGRSLAGAAVPAALVSMAMLAITGCAGTHVGDDWQCPMAQGEICASVSAADPAVPAGAERADSPLPAGEIPLYRPRQHNLSYLAREEENAAAEVEKECGRGFGVLLPFAWLGSLFTPDSHASDFPASSSDAGREMETASPFGAEPAIFPGSESDSGQAGETDTPTTELVTRVTRKPAHDDAREPERIGRVWIGPFVDIDGVYREASWVRIVIAPAEWRVP